jgi:hypothetical protein
VRTAAIGSENMKSSKTMIVLFSLLLARAGYCQQAGVAEGRLINRTDPSIIARNVDLEVIGLQGGMSIIKTAVTDSSGRFRIEGLPDNERLMIRANYKSANYYGQLSFKGGTANVDIEVYEPTTSMEEIHVDGVQMAFQVEGDHLKQVETISYNNKTKPPRTFVNPEGTFRVSKAPGILEPPKITVTAPGSTMPVVQSGLESPDGESYYSLYPLRPGVTTFEVQQLLPYANRNYVYRSKLFQDAGSVQVGVIPRDLALSGQGLSMIQTDTAKNFAVYTSGPIKAGKEFVWTFSGGTAAVETTSESEAAGQSDSVIKPLPEIVGRNALVIGPLLLMGFVIVLWYAFNHGRSGNPDPEKNEVQRLQNFRQKLVNQVATLDQRYERRMLNRQEYLVQREEGMRQLRRVSLLLRKHGNGK